MATPADLPKKWEHGTRACYVGSKCRCDLCRKANREYVAARNKLACEAAATVTPGICQPQTWTAPDGTKKVRMYSRACPGPDGRGCPHKSHLRKDSKGGVCGECRKKLIWNGLVPAEKAREHLMALSAKNVGRRAVAAACDVAETVLVDIRSGAKTQIRADTERRILSVDEQAVSDHALVPAKETWKRIKKLIRYYGYTKGEIALDLGYINPALQLGKKFVLAETELIIKRMYDEAVATIDKYEAAAKTNHLSRSYTADEVRRLLPLSFTELRKRFGLEDPSAQRALYRVLHAVGAVKSSDGVWSIPPQSENASLFSA